MIRVNCNLCKSDNHLLLLRINRYKVPLEIVKCKRCGLIYQNPRPQKDNIIKDFYSEGYYTGRSPVAYIKDFSEEINIANERLKIIEKAKSPGRLLDIGCYSGAFLYAAQKRGWDSYGTDIAPFIIEKAKARALNVFLGEISEINFKDNLFDLITLFEVIEHLPNPLETLIEIHRILKDEGILIIQVTNMNSLRMRYLKSRSPYYSPVHLYYFNKKLIIKMLKKADFEIIKIINGSEFDISTEIRLFKGTASLGNLLLRKLLNRLEFRGFTLNSSMVIYAKKSH